MSFGGSSAPEPINIQPTIDANAQRLAKEAAAREAQALRKKKGAMSMIATSPQGAADANTKSATLGA